MYLFVVASTLLVDCTIFADSPTTGVTVKTPPETATAASIGSQPSASVSKL